MEKVKNTIKTILPSINEETRNNVMEKLQELGVTDCSHLELVEEQDLLPTLKVIQARLLIRGWRNNVEDISIDSSNKINDTGATTSTSTTEDEIVLLKTPCRFDPNKFLIPWESMPVELMRSLRENKRPKPSLRNCMIRIIAEKVYGIEKKPGRKALAVIAERVVGKYPSSLSDEICKDMSSESHLSCLKQLEVRFDNINRSSTFNMLKRSLKNEKNYENCKKVRLSDCYGCVNYQPTLPLEETVKSQIEKKEKMKLMSSSGFVALDQECRNLLKATYFTIRKDINSGKSLNFLVEEWPLLFVKEGFLEHFNELVGIKIEEKLNLAISKKGITIISYFLNKPKVKAIHKDKFENTILQFESNVNDKEQMYTWEVLVSLLMTYFGESIDALFVTVDIASTVNEVEMNIPNTPCLICYGDEIKNASSYMLAVDSKVVIQHIKKFQDGLAILFSSFYCLNIEYPLSASATLECIQRCFLDINPLKGSKVNSSRKIKEVVNPKITMLKKNITDFEWNL